MYDIFSLPDIKFPKGFLWGSSTAGHQIEGDNIHSHRSEMENSAEYLAPWFRSPSGKACNHYELYPQDIKMLEEMKHQAFRMSIEWSRIEPEEGRYDNAAVDHYLHELSLLKEKGIKVFMTLHHLTHPMWFEKKNAFRNLENLQYFERYLEYIVPKIAEYVDYWNVINEFNMGQGAERFDFKMNMVRFHARGYHVIKKYSKAPVSTAHAFVQYFARGVFDRFDNIMADYYDWTEHEFFFHAMRTGEIVFPFKDCIYDKEVKDTVDYWAVNAYTRTMIDARKATGVGDRYVHKQLKMLPMDFYLEEMYPEGMTAILGRLKDKPVYITENGCSCEDDRFRIVYIALYLSAIKEAMEMGTDVRGYLYWSLMDNYEWGSFVPRFGLVDVNFDTFERTLKPSALFYRDIIQNNGFSQDILRKYLKELPTLEKR